MILSTNNKIRRNTKHSPAITFRAFLYDFINFKQKIFSLAEMFVEKRQNDKQTRTEQIPVPALFLYNLSIRRIWNMSIPKNSFKGNINGYNKKRPPEFRIPCKQRLGVGGSVKIKYRKNAKRYL